MNHELLSLKFQLIIKNKAKIKIFRQQINHKDLIYKVMYKKIKILQKEQNKDNNQLNGQKNTK